MQDQTAIHNLVGVESELNVFFENAVDENLRTKAACMVLAKLGQLYGSKDDAQIKTCPHADVPCGGHEFLPNGARAHAPKDSRAAIRAELLRMFGNRISIANWHYVVSFEDKCAYLLPDEPKTGSAEAIRGAKTLKEAAGLLNLSRVELYCIKELHVQANETSGQPEGQIVTSK